MAFENQSFEPINSSEIFIGILFYIALNVALTLLLYAFPENPPYFVRQILNNFCFNICNVYLVFCFDINQ